MTGIAHYWIWIVYSLVTIFSLFYVRLMFKYLRGWNRLSFTIPKNLSTSTKVSVVIACRNESTNVRKCLDSLVNQSYNTALYEVIIVNDHSVDDTPDIIQSYSNQFANVRLINLEEGTGKRAALSEGIKQANGDFIMTTDGDCWVEPTWIESVVQVYESQQSKMVLGPVRFTKGYNLLTKFQELDFIGMIGIAGGSTSNGYPHVCNGANLSYEKSAFEQIQGFDGEEKNPSGDDMILLQKMNVVYQNQIHFVKINRAMTYTDAMHNWKDFLNQRIRWASKSGEMLDKKITLILGSVLVYNLIPVLLIINAIWIEELWLLLAMHVGLKFIVDSIFFSRILGFFERKSLLLFYPIAQVMHIFYIVAVGALSQFVSFDWKGRKIQA
jgi:cellulose synthase/poly-beta-1,6-N-acetylglucosamine synthase-like glycosyltransferase